MVYFTQAESLNLLIWQKVPFALGGKGLLNIIFGRSRDFICFQHKEVGLYFAKVSPPFFPS